MLEAVCTYLFTVHIPLTTQSFGKQWVNSAPISLLRVLSVYPGELSRSEPHSSKQQEESVRDSSAQQQQQEMLCSKYGSQQPVLIASAEDTEGLDGYEPQSLQYKLVTGFRIVPGVGGETVVDEQQDGVEMSSQEQQLPPMQPVHNLRQLASAVLSCQVGD